MTDPIESIVREIEQLLRERNVQLSTSGYDSLQIWDLKPGESPVYSNGIEDKRQGDQGSWVRISERVPELIEDDDGPVFGGNSDYDCFGHVMGWNAEIGEAVLLDSTDFERLHPAMTHWRHTGIRRIDPPANNG